MARSGDDFCILPETPSVSTTRCDRAVKGFFVTFTITWRRLNERGLHTHHVRSIITFDVVNVPVEIVEQNR